MPLYREDFSAYGPELIDMSQRAAREALAPEIDALKQKQWELQQREQKLQNQTIFDKLSTAIPTWRTINADPDFYVRFLGTQEEYSGRPAIELLREGFAQGDFNRVKAFFDAYLRATGQAPATQAPTPVQARQSQAPASQNITTAIEQFYRDKTAGKWRGREKEADAYERQLHAAAHSRR